MIGSGLIRDLLHLSLYLITIVIWMHLWLICVFNAKGPLKRFFGAHALIICALGVPALAALLFGCAYSLFGREGMIASLIIGGLGFPAATLLLLRRQAQRGRS
ncbi:hypothetical protein QN382_12620 [Pseudomonas sp. 10B1]|uniref:hypothetical protein n=1 Tax=unclassified Pseudomonas TaxID=196821 RepID=UPI002AB391BE|nr:MULTISPECIES: hypothetical protein [unclassified Pseudomonas]MDY7558952.1 hypothetical protein [Pseudomonas sp. AB6]MEA9997152.1 hypothetical protein [Pseudomonas sp. AA4]MEB0089404.1 hypothetical protein [Pseudomonas sp. RTI1]MEB0124679.1 hypothetical protein [Pseudomonas sp. CCC1.2]MEB0154943.1 hypothetical protein [Pseudomonas sp. CCC4.3]